MFKDEMKDWYKIAKGKGIENNSIKLDKNFKKHLILPCSMIAMIGSTGSGKTSALIEFLSRKNDAFTRIIIFTGSTSDEPLYNFLKKHIKGIEIIDNPEELPNLHDMNEEEKNTEKLIVFDDFINMNKKDLKQIQNWFIASRKYGYSAIALCQSYTEIPIALRRNIQYFIIFRLNDVNSINQIIKTHNNIGDDKEAIKNMYFEATEEPKNFFLLDLKDPKYRYRHNFLDILDINNFI